ncbi:MAG: ion transporter [Alphaproteobacteria bacterium]|nr:ion transporter [Alphaproteobacteria bacterium]
MILDRTTLTTFIERQWVQNVITGAILLNAVTLGLETSPTVMAEIGPILLTLDSMLLTLFVAELGIKLLAYRRDFFRSSWNIFDFLIVAISLAPLAANLSVLRALRILRVLRLMSIVPSMRKVVTALLSAVPGIMSVAAVLGITFYVFSVLATKLFGGSPDAQMQEWFGTIGRSLFTLFQIMTLESWSMGIARPTMELFPLSWIFFVVFVLATSFTVLNLFIAIIVNAMQSEHEAEADADRKDIKNAAHADAEAILEEVKALRAEVRALRQPGQ